MSDRLQPKIILKEATLRIPIFSNTNNSIKNKILTSFTGGRISIENKIQSVLALNSISCKLYEGEKIALIGHNGNKTSFIRTVSGIYKLSSGSIERKVDVYPMIEKSFIVEEELTGYDSAKAHYLIMNNSLDGFEEFLEYVIEFSGIGEYFYLSFKDLQ